MEGIGDDTPHKTAFVNILTLCIVAFVVLSTRHTNIIICI